MRDVRMDISRRMVLFVALAGLGVAGCDSSLADPIPGSNTETRLSWSVALNGSNPYLAGMSSTPIYNTALYNTAFQPDAAAITDGALTVEAWDNETEMGSGGTGQQSWLTFAVPGFEPNAPRSGRFSPTARAALPPAVGQRPILALGRLADRGAAGNEWVFAGFNAAGPGTFDYRVVSSTSRYLELLGSFEIPVVSVGLTPAVVGVVRGEIHAKVPKHN